jgi:glycosyltransferase involved in cell wall biosynthesis
MTTTEPPAIAVIVPAHNHAQYLDACLESLAAQSLPPAEIVVVDDGSSDETVAVAERAAARSQVEFRVLQQPHLGFVPALTAGITNTTSPWFVHIDADDLLAPDFLDGLAAALAAAPQAAFAYPMIDLFDREQGIYLSGPFNRGRLVFEGNYIPHVALIRRDAFDATRGYRSLPTHVDWDLWLSFLEAGHYGVFVPHVLYHWRRHGETMTTRPGWVRLSSRLNVMWTHRGLVLRSAPLAPWWLAHAIWRRTRLRLARLGLPEPPYDRTESAWIYRQSA